MKCDHRPTQKQGHNSAPDTPVGFWLVHPIRLYTGPASAGAPHRFCEPSGVLSPELPADCEPFPEPAICSTTYACCRPDGTCADLNQIDCATAGGMFYGPGTEGGGDDGLKCADEPPCKPLVACTLAAATDISGCEMVPSDYCHLQPGRISLPCTCGEVIFGEPGSPKCPE